MVKISTWIMGVLFALSFVWTIVMFVAPNTVLEGDSQAIAGKSYQELMPADAVPVAFAHIRHMSAIAAVGAIASFFILFGGFRKTERWAWWAMFVTGILMWGFGVGINLVITNYSDLVPFAVGLVATVVALLLPVRQFFPAKG